MSGGRDASRSGSRRLTVLVVGLATFDEMAGGSARYLSGFVDALRADGHEVIVQTAARHVSTVGFSQSGVVGQVRRAATRFLVVMPRTFLHVLLVRPDVVNSHFALDGFPAVVAAMLTRTPVVVTFHGPWALEAIATGRRGRWPLSTRVRRAVEVFVYRRAARCITLSSAFADVLAREYGVRRRRISVIPGGLDTPRFADPPAAADARRRLGLPERLTLVTVRRLVPRMGLELAIDALAELAPEWDAQLVIAGSGPERERLEGHARERGLADRVTFLGRVADEDLAVLYAAGDVCVVPSRQLEGFGYVALEALASGTPVVAAGTGGLAELVGGLEPRWVVPADAGSLADAVRLVASAAGGLPSRPERVDYASRMDWTNVLPRLLAVFEEAIAAGHRPRTPGGAISAPEDRQGPSS